MTEHDWQTVASTLFGGGAVLTLAKGMLSRALAELEHLTRKVEDQAIRMAAINVKLEAVDRMIQAVAEHDKQIAILDVRSQANVAQGRSPSNRPS